MTGVTCSRPTGLGAELHWESGKSSTSCQLKGTAEQQLLPLPIPHTGSPRPQALIFYTHTLAESDAKLQQAACVALQQLRVSP